MCGSKSNLKKEKKTFYTNLIQQTIANHILFLTLYKLRKYIQLQVNKRIEIKLCKLAKRNINLRRNSLTTLGTYWILCKYLVHIVINIISSS